MANLSDLKLGCLAASRATVGGVNHERLRVQYREHRVNRFSYFGQWVGRLHCHIGEKGRVEITVTYDSPQVSGDFWHFHAAKNQQTMFESKKR